MPARSDEEGTGRDRRRLVGVVPAAGRASRLAPLPCSKEIFPVGFARHGDSSELRPTPVCQYLLEGLRCAGAGEVYVVIGADKWDIPARLGDGRYLGLQLAYLVAEDSPDATTTVDHATPFVRDATVLFGFPDIICDPVDLFTGLLRRQAERGADIVLALLPADQPHKVDMVATAADGAVQEIVIKPAATDLTHAWVAAAWTPAFTEFLHRFQQERDLAATREVHVGEVVQAAIDAGRRVDSVAYPGGRFIDVGTPEDLARAVRLYTERDICD